MSRFIPKFVPVPSQEIMQMINVISCIIGVCLLGAGLYLVFHDKRKEKGTVWVWGLLLAGGLLIVNHGMQILF